MESFAETEKKQKECEKLLQSAGFSMPDPGTGKEMGTHRAAKTRRPAGGVVVAWWGTARLALAGWPCA